MVHVHKRFEHKKKKTLGRCIEDIKIIKIHF